MLVSKEVLNYLATLLATDGSFSVIDPQAAYHEDESGTKPIVEMHISGGDFFAPGSSPTGDKLHSFTIEIHVIASASAKYDLSVIENPSSTEEEVATAMIAGLGAANIAYGIIFEVFSLIFDLINNRANYDFGLEKYTLKKKELGKYNIERHVTSGNLATVHGMSKIDLLVVEPVEGVTPIASEEPPVQGVIAGDLPG